MGEIPAQIPEEYKKSIKEEEQPEWIDPMLAKLTHDEFSDANWIYERKLDGVRCIVFKNGKEVNIFSRNGNNVNRTYPEIVEAIRNQPAEKFIIDGEIVAFRGEVTSFSELQKRMQLSNAEEINQHATAVFCYVFDLVHFSGRNISELPVLERKKILEKLITFEDPIRYTPHRKEKGLEFLEKACSDKWEGLIAKKADSKYTFGRSSNWLKFKCTARQELVIGGYTEPAGARKGFGSLLLGYYENEEFLYAGKVGTGFTDEFLEELFAEMSDLEINDPPFSNAKQIRSKNVHWVEPELVAELSFTEWTSGNKLRHPSFLGLRRDKDPKDVRKES